MKILRANIENFRLLRGVTLEFATGAQRNVTVIRAANESGKTTLLIALQWALFGDDALPDSGNKYRLSPIDIPAEPPNPITVSVEVDYEVSTRVGRTQQYRVIRSASETPTPDGMWRREPTKVNLFNLTSTGAVPLSNPEARIRPHLPHDLREVFFTDGDRALSFIEGNRADQVRRVEGAIRSLLGLKTVESARDHARQVSSNLNRRIRKNDGSRDELQLVTERLTTLQQQQPSIDKDIKKANDELLRLEDLEKRADTRLSDALRQGNKEELVRSLEETKQMRQEAERDAALAARDHANLFKSELLAKHFLADLFSKAKSQLELLHNQRQIPSQTIPVLEARLDHNSCICGESLDHDTADGRRRRKHIELLIDENRTADQKSEKLTALYYGSQNLLSPPDDRTWTDDYNDVFERRVRANRRVKEFGLQEADIDAQISQLPDVDIRQLRATRNQYQSQVKERQAKLIRLTTMRDDTSKEIEQTEARRSELLSRDEKGMQIAAELDVAKDLEKLLEKTLDTMRTRELKQVSDSMNTLFLAMIGADAAEKAIIKQAEITPEFRIVVSGPHDQPLDPSQDLNGASRRALTIAFILALAQVSQVEAPNVIDTPLGMLSGYVKQAVLRIASQHSAQLILMLTHSEINECEEILDRRVGRIYTLTNPAHYPRILVNDPGVEDSRVLLCKCDHRSHCRVCQRRESPEPNNEEVLK